MSIDATRWVWKLTKDKVTPTEKLLLLAIADRCGEEGECWPSISRLVRDTGYHRDAVIQNRKSLIEKGILSFTGEYRGRSKQIPIMKLMCDEWRKGDESDDDFPTEIDQSSKTTSRPKHRVPVVQDDTYQSSWTTQNLKEEPKRLNNNISTSHEVPNIVYTESDEQEDEKEKPDYFNNHEASPLSDTQVIEAEKNPLKSDYFDNQCINNTKGKLTKHYGLKNILDENIFKIPEQLIQDWITTRMKKRVAVTQTAWNKINKELAKCKEHGMDPIEAFETMVASGWQSMKAEWLLTAEAITKQEVSKKRSIELEKMAYERKQREIQDSKRFSGIVSQVSENERAKLRKLIGSRAPQNINTTGY